MICAVFGLTPRAPYHPLDQACHCLVSAAEPRQGCSERAAQRVRGEQSFVASVGGTCHGLCEMLVKCGKHGRELRGAMTRRRSRLVAVAAVVCAAVVAAATLAARFDAHGAAVLDQQEIGTSESAADPHEELAVDNEYEAAMPFRDPGHISRAEIRLAHALARSDSTPKDETWNFVRPLWSKYLQVDSVACASARTRTLCRAPAAQKRLAHGLNTPQAMRDPADVEPGWTNPRHETPDADPLQQAMERHAYGAEGHREPQQEWDVGKPASGPGFEWARDVRHGMGQAKPSEAEYQSAMPHMMRESRAAGARRGDEALEQQVADMRKMLKADGRAMRDLKGQVSALRSAAADGGDGSGESAEARLRQALTYKVIHDKVEHGWQERERACVRARARARASVCARTCVRVWIQVSACTFHPCMPTCTQTHR